MIYRLYLIITQNYVEEVFLTEREAQELKNKGFFVTESFKNEEIER